MAKKIIIGLLLVLLLGGALWQSLYLSDATDKLTKKASDVQHAIEQNDMQTALMAADAFIASWNDEKQFYEALFDHDDIDLISATAERLRSYCASQHAQNALAEAAALIYYINHIKEINAVSWENIF